MTEMWKPVKGYEGVYEVSNFGNVRSKNRSMEKATFKGKQLCPVEVGRGYLRVVLSKNGVISRKLVHRLVAEAFVENPRNVDYVNHVDGNKKNNRAENLEWCTAKENTNHANSNGLINHKTRKNIDQAKRNVQKAYKDRITAVVQYDKMGRFINKYKSIKQAEKESGVDRRRIGECVRGKRKYAGDYIWGASGKGDL